MRVFPSIFPGVLTGGSAHAALLRARSGGDPDAKLYVAEVEAGLGTSILLALPGATSDPKRAISNFIIQEKDEGRWTLHKRIYLPIYNNAAASAVDMVGRTSGTFQGLSGSVTHAVGYVQGDGASGYFQPAAGSEYGNLGLSNSSASIFYLALDETVKTESFHGIAGSSTQRFGIGVPASLGTMFLHPDSSATTLVQFAGQRSGIFVGSSTATDYRSLLRTTSSGFTRGINTVSSTSTLPNIVPFFMARNNNGSPALYANSKLGLFGFGLGLTSSQDEPFSMNLKTLYEGLTGTTLP